MIWWKIIVKRSDWNQNTWSLNTHTQTTFTYKHIYIHVEVSPKGISLYTYIWREREGERMHTHMCIYYIWPKNHLSLWFEAVISSTGSCLWTLGSKESHALLRDYWIFQIRGLTWETKSLKVGFEGYTALQLNVHITFLVKSNIQRLCYQPKLPKEKSLSVDS